MTKTFKILSAISFIAMAIVLTFVGVWALTDLDFTVGGDITYTAPEPEPVTPEEVSYLTFEYYDDLTAKLMSCSSSAPQVVEIPAQIEKDGKTYTVTSIKEGYYDELEDEGQGIFPEDRSDIDLIIPDTIIEIGSYAFFCCNFDSVSIGTSIEQDFIYNNNAFRSGSIETLIIRKGVIRIGECAFMNESIADCTLPNTLTSIGNESFSYCYTFTSITIPDGVTSIGEFAFTDCMNLINVTIGNGVKSIGQRTFQNCTSLVKVEVKATTPPNGEGFMFDSCSSSLVIYVPTASVDAYKSAEGWSEYADKIQGKDFN